MTTTSLPPSRDPGDHTETGPTGAAPSGAGRADADAAEAGYFLSDTVDSGAAESDAADACPPRADASGSGPSESGVGGLLARVVAAVRVELAQVADTPTFGLSAMELTGLLQDTSAAMSSLGELQARLVAEADGRGLAKDAGCTSTTAWLRSTTGVSGTTAGRMTALARALGTEAVSPTRRAWAAGVLTGDQAHVIADAVNRLCDVEPARLAAAQADLILRASEHSVAELARLANRLVEVADPDTADRLLGDRLAAEEQRAWQTTRLHFARRGDGTTRFTGCLPDVQADIFKKTLEAWAAPRRRKAEPGIAQPRPGQPGPGERSPGGHSPGEGSSGEPGPGERSPGERSPGDGRSGEPGPSERRRGELPALNPDGDHSGTEIGLLSYQQRLGRALAELLEHLPADRMPQAGGLAASVVVTMNLDNLTSGVGTAVLDTGTELSASQARRLACNATLLPAVLDGESAILDLGMGQRLFDRHQRLALATRDRGCVWPGCERPPAWCEAHHVTPYSRGGPTDLANGALVCGFHHRLLHAGEWAARVANDGVVEIIPPVRIDPRRTPLRHARFKADTSGQPLRPPDRPPC
jgi:hypothetical protein